MKRNEEALGSFAYLSSCSCEAEVLLYLPHHVKGNFLAHSKALLSSYGLEPYLDYGARDKEQQPRIITQHATARACFATWAADREGINTSFRQSVIELCLLHQNEDNCPYGRAYNRNELIDDRRVVMEAWNDFCLSECPELQAMAAKFKYIA